MFDLIIVLENLKDISASLGIFCLFWMANFSLSMYYNIDVLQEGFDKDRMISGIKKLIMVGLGMLFLVLGIPVSLFLIVQTFLIPDLVDYLSLLYVNMGTLVIVETIATFKLKSSKSYSNAKVFRYYLYFITAILLWMIFN